MKQIKFLAFSFVLAACAHGKMGTVEQALEKGSVNKNTPIIVEPVNPTNAQFSGDKSALKERTDQEKSEIQNRLAKMIVEQLNKRGYKASVGSGTAPKKGLVLSGRTTKIEHGSAAARILVGMGSGSANMFTEFQLDDKTANKSLSKFEVIGTSGGRSGIYAAGSFLEAHLIDTATKVAEYLDGQTK